MTEENNTTSVVENALDAATAPTNNINISIEQILAAVVKTVGQVNVKIEDLLQDYSNFTIALNQEEDKSVNFTLVELQDTPAEEAVAE
jgi:hypothetical protein